MKPSFVTRMVAAPTAVVALSLCAIAADASTCYIVYDRNDQAVYRDLYAPVDLSKPIGQQVAARWRGGALVIVGDATRCIPFEASTVAAAVSTDGATQASPSEPAQKSTGAKRAKAAAK
jgi:hypothetical protein